MITINIGGGLGNQLFQYATARSLSNKNNSKLILDISFFDNIPKNDTYRTLKINNFNIRQDKIERVKKNKIIRSIYRLLLRPLNSDSQIIIFKILSKLKIPIFLTRNFQKEKYFINIRNILLREIEPLKPLSPDAKKIEYSINKSMSISLHIRRTDYIEMENVYGGCSIQYYKESIKIIKDEFDDPIFYIFSDDIGWVKNNFVINEKHFYVSQKTIQDYEELILMSKCKHNIIANSTFSWWGAWLNKNDNKIVIAPRQWFKNKTSDELEIIPKNWIQLKNN